VSFLDRAAAPDLSVILPSYRAGEVATQSVRDLQEYLDRIGLNFEVIVVDDGGGDLLEGLGRGDPRIKLLPHASNRGKGAAVRTGMLAARGRVRIFTDADLPFELDLLPLIVYYVRDRGFHLVVGDRTFPTSQYDLDVGWKRRLASLLFSKVVGTMVTGGFFDTQCGLKGFRGDVAEEIFRCAGIDRFAFDVEVLYLALKHRLDIKRIPVTLRRNQTTSVRLVRDSAQALFDVLRIKIRQLSGRYDSRELRELADREFRQERAALRHGPE
jgi:dolichyl-phosphate beta-glucosyltransferase